MFGAEYNFVKFPEFRAPMLEGLIRLLPKRDMVHPLQPPQWHIGDMLFLGTNQYLHVLRPAQRLYSICCIQCLLMLCFMQCCCFVLDPCGEPLKLNIQDARRAEAKARVLVLLASVCLARWNLTTNPLPIYIGENPRTRMSTSLSGCSASRPSYWGLLKARSVLKSNGRKSG